MNASVSIVVALTDPGLRRLAESLGRFAEEAGPLGEVVLVDASGTPAASELARGFANVRVVTRPGGSLAPELWRAGLLATKSRLVAFTTAQMIPRPGWLNQLRSRLVEVGAAGVGGPIEPGPGLSTTDRAVALLRYAGYFPPLPGSSRSDPPGDNALYRRDLLMEVGASWLDGFHEVEVHRALRDRGHALAMADGALVAFEGGVRLVPMMAQRFRHARRYGLGRSIGLGRGARMARVVAAPLVPPLLCGRIVRALRARKMPLPPWLSSWPGLILLATAWAIGEAVGTWQAGAIRSVDRPEHQPMNQPLRKAG